MNDVKIKAFGICIYKITKNSVEILLCKSISSLDKWGCLKGLKEKNETEQECAKREFFEESSIDINDAKLEKYFEQKNKNKDIGIWLVNAKNIKNLDKYFLENKLIDVYLSWENAKVKFFDIDKIPAIRKKQINLISEITCFLKSKHQPR